MITSYYQVDEVKKRQINRMIETGYSAEEAFSTHGVSIELKEAVLNPTKKQVVAPDIFDVDGFAKKYKNAIGY